MTFQAAQAINTQMTIINTIRMERSYDLEKWFILMIVPAEFFTIPLNKTSIKWFLEKKAL